jgi:hypothetical protein
MRKQKSKRGRKLIKPKFINELKRPPVSKRYCIICKKVRVFKYNRNIGHSCCICCGGHYSVNPKNIKIKETTKIHG